MIVERVPPLLKMTMCLDPAIEPSNIRLLEELASAIGHQEQPDRCCTGRVRFLRQQLRAIPPAARL